MCGRFAISAKGKEIAKKFSAEVSAMVEPRYNIAPTQPIGIIRENPNTDRRESAIVTWGLVPSWAKDPAVATNLTNARAETAQEKPSFRDAMRYRRCLIPANAFYEWKRSGSSREPFCFRLEKGELFAFAGIWEHWQSADGSEIESACILTQAAGSLMRSIHHRQPVILGKKDIDRWLDTQCNSRRDVDQLQDLLRHDLPSNMERYPVSLAVNNARNQGAELIEPIKPETEQIELF